MNVIQYFERHPDEILQATIEHIWLVGIAMLIAVAIGVPLGILVARRPWLSKPILGTANVAETIPSLALFGFLLPVPWLGDRAARLAIAALALYALLPIIRNTAAGITSVDPAVREAARGMGMTPRQILFKVELPLSLSTVLAGVRVATVLTIGIATIAAAIGAGGLGEYIFRGLAMVNNSLILAGAIPAALLALGADFFLSVLERWLRPGAMNATMRRLAALLILGLLACGVRLRASTARHDRHRLEEFSGAGAAWRNSGAAHRSAHASSRGAPLLSCGQLHLPAGHAGGTHRRLRRIHGHGAYGDPARSDRERPERCLRPRAKRVQAAIRFRRAAVARLQQHVRAGNSRRRCPPPARENHFGCRSLCAAMARRLRIRIHGAPRRLSRPRADLRPATSPGRRKYWIWACCIARCSTRKSIWLRGIRPMD